MTRPLCCLLLLAPLAVALAWLDRPLPARPPAAGPHGWGVAGYGQPTGLVVLVRAETPDWHGRAQRVAEICWHRYLAHVWQDGAGNWLDGGRGPMVFLTPDRPETYSPEYYPTVQLGCTGMRWAGGGSRAVIGDFLKPPPAEGWECRPPHVYIGGGNDAQVALSVAHELGHGFGLKHKAGTVMENKGNLNCWFDAEERAVFRAGVAGMKARTRQFVK